MMRARNRRHGFSRVACRAAGGVTLLLLAPPARADPLGGLGAGIALLIGFFVVVLPILEIGIITAEALTYRSLLGMGGRQAAVVSIVANLLSLFVGYTVGSSWLLAHPLPVELVLMGLVAVAVEVPIVLLAARSHPDRRRVATVAAGVNIVTYSVGTALFLAVLQA